MRSLVEKSILFTISFYMSALSLENDSTIIYILISLIIILALDLLKTSKARIILFIVFFLLSINYKEIRYFIPLGAYSLYEYSKLILLLVPYFLVWGNYGQAILTVQSIYMAKKNLEYTRLLRMSKDTRDELKEDTIILKKYNKQLEIDREKNIHIAILSERNRISRKLHDSIGHLISSSILQLEALKVLNRDENLNPSLDLLQSSLKNGMVDVRKSIHDLYRESLDLREAIARIIEENPSLEISLDYRMDEDLNYEVKYDVLSVVKEAVTNVKKHSDSNKVDISLVSMPGFHLINIRDYGQGKEIDQLGLGLISMEEVYKKYSGNGSFGFDNGFKIHMVLMKGD